MLATFSDNLYYSSVFPTVSKKNHADQLFSPDSEPNSDSNPNLDPEPDPEPNLNLDPDPEPDPEPNPNLDPEPDLEPEPNLNLDPDPDPEPNLNLDPDPEPNLNRDLSITVMSSTYKKSFKGLECGWIFSALMRVIHLQTEEVKCTLTQAQTVTCHVGYPALQNDQEVGSHGNKSLLLLFDWVK